MSQTSGCSVNYFCIGAFLIFVGSILLCALGFTVVLPYEATRDWNKVTCRVINATYSTSACSCRRELNEYEPCVVRYPCLQIYVTYIGERRGDVFSDGNSMLKQRAFESHADVIDIESSLTEVPHVSNQVRVKRLVMNTNVRPTSHYPQEDPTLTEASDTDNYTAVVTNTNPSNTSGNANTNSGNNSSSSLHPNATEHFPTHTHGMLETSSEPPAGVSVVKQGQMLQTPHGMPALEDPSALTTSHSSKQDDPDFTTLAATALKAAETVSASLSDEATTRHISNTPSQSQEMEAMLYRNWDDSFYKMECGDDEWNIKETSRFRLQWGRDGLAFQCYSDPDEPGTVVVERISRSTMMHAVIWPMITLLCGISLWLGLCLGCCSIHKKPTDVETTKRTSHRRQYGLLHAQVTIRP